MTTSKQQGEQDIRILMNEIKTLKIKIDKLENIVEKRLVGEDAADEYEKSAIAEFQKKRKTGKLEFVPLSKVMD